MSSYVVAYMFASTASSNRMPHGPVASSVPNLFLVGAPKSGTTSLASYLAGHPEIFVPSVKELHYFGADLPGRAALTIDEYLWHYRHAGKAKYRGDASVWYLYSQSAAGEIRAASAAARIIAILRDPVDMMYSLHSQAILNAQEPTIDFAEALMEDAESRNPEVELRGARRTWRYRDVASYSEQVARYLAVFGRESVHVCFYEDLRADPQGTYRRTLEFLGLPDDGRDVFEVTNANRRPRSRAAAAFMFAPPELVRRVGHALLPHRGLRRHLGDRLARLNAVTAPRPPMDPELRRTLSRETRSEASRLRALLGTRPPWGEGDG